jgi:antitoxin VapB
MSLNIKSAEAHALARRLAEETGETLTRAVTVALRERLQRLERTDEPEAKARDLLRIGRRCADSLVKRPVDSGEWLYDEHGAPK